MINSGQPRRKQIMETFTRTTFYKGAHMLTLLQQTLILKGVSWISNRPKNDVEQSKYQVNEKNDNIKKAEHQEIKCAN